MVFLKQEFLVLRVLPPLNDCMMIELELQPAAAVVIFIISDGGLLASLIRQHAMAMVILGILEGTLVGLVCIEFFTFCEMNGLPWPWHF